MTSSHWKISQVKVKSRYGKVTVFLVGEFVTKFEYTARNHIAQIREVGMNEIWALCRG